MLKFEEHNRSHTDDGKAIELFDCLHSVLII